MKLNKTELLGALNALNVPYESRGPLLSLAVGRVIAYGLKLPATPGDSDDILTDDVRNQIEKLVYDVNENFSIDADSAISVASRVYLFRYRLVHSPFNPAVVEFMDALLRTGVSSLSPVQADLMTKYAEDKSLLNSLARCIWNQAVVVDVEETAQSVAATVESAVCVCPSLECRAHPDGTVVSAEGAKGAVLGAAAAMIPGVSLVSGGAMGHMLQEAHKKIEDLEAKLDAAHTEIRELKNKVHGGH